MKFAAMVLFGGLAGLLLASNLRGQAVASGDGLVAAMQPSMEVTGSIGPSPSGSRPSAVRLIDLRNGATCKIAQPTTSAETFQRMPVGPGCGTSPDFARVALWRSGPDGTLIMADTAGQTVLEFAPGDGVLFESVYPPAAMITIVPARS